ncbi:ATP-binding protein [Novosphingobium mangrovi (ex Huang et al. 2023)]|uniref:ATP-binding protein n=1 Tax=Novosphingobium mangrovi (ex Huang et al. 2023) TaxID=2976432 RepID=A0ABT2I915_9SPHN|nr:ATP-binding protein [Novosphingobium mangrovi (ex Huang et al. 2023)]MCT2401309.1 ATP-binding protein [Novosphingobium mangrovi (ex Huang et al. 2023)]
MTSPQHDHGVLLSRIADALERLAPPSGPVCDWLAHPAYVWTGSSARAVEHLDAPALDLLRGIDAQKERVVTNVERLAAGHAAHDMLLWGSRGMGKSAVLRAAIRAAQDAHPGGIALVQVAQEALSGVTALFATLGRIDRRFLVFIDDLGFEENDGAGPRLLRSWLEGGVEARPANVRLAVTSNRRAIVARSMSEQDDPINPRDVVDDRLALADRFGLSIGFHNCDQDAYLSIIGGYAQEFGLEWESGDALEWSRRRGARSGRVAWQYVNELAGRAGKAI